MTFTNRIKRIAHIKTGVERYFEKDGKQVRRIPSHLLSELVNDVWVAKQRFDETVEKLEAMAAQANDLDKQGVPFITKQGALRLKEQFETQRKAAEDLHRLLSDADEVLVIADEFSEEEDR